MGVFLWLGLAITLADVLVILAACKAAALAPGY
jgi:hypothetical protein